MLAAMMTEWNGRINSMDPMTTQQHPLQILCSQNTHSGEPVLPATHTKFCKLINYSEWNHFSFEILLYFI
jgi:hypothetical protein